MVHTGRGSRRRPESSPEPRDLPCRTEARTAQFPARPWRSKEGLPCRTEALHRAAAHAQPPPGSALAPCRTEVPHAQAHAEHASDGKQPLGPSRSSAPDDASAPRAVARCRANRADRRSIPLAAPRRSEPTARTCRRAETLQRVRAGSGAIFAAVTAGESRGGQATVRAAKRTARERRCAKQRRLPRSRGRPRAFASRCEHVPRPEPHRSGVHIPRKAGRNLRSVAVPDRDSSSGERTTDTAAGSLSAPILSPEGE